MDCRHCGTRLGKDANFCTGCGSPAAPAASSQATAAAPQTAPAQKTIGQPLKATPLQIISQAAGKVGIEDVYSEVVIPKTGFTRLFTKGGDQMQNPPPILPAEDAGFFWQQILEEDRALLMNPDNVGDSQHFSSLRVLTSPNDPVTADNVRTFLATLARSCPQWFMYSLVATPANVYTAVTGPTAAALKSLQAHLLSYYPDTAFAHHDTRTELNGPRRTVTAWRTDYALNPLGIIGDFNPDPFTPFLTFAEHELKTGESMAVSIAFRPALPHRIELMLHSIGTEHVMGGAVWDNVPLDRKEIPRFVDHKQSAPPFWDVDIFSIGYAETKERLVEIQACFSQFFQQFNLYWPTLNKIFKLVPQAFDELPEGYDVWERNLLNTAELAGLVHFPHKSVASPILLRTTHRIKPAPDVVTGSEGLLLGVNEYHGIIKTVRLPHERRSQHMYIIGAAGSGKSTLLANAIKQDIIDGRGCAIIDPHGDLVNELLHHIPESRIADTIYFNAADREFPVSLNPLTAESEQEIEAVKADFMVLFRRLFSVEDAHRMLHILRHTVLTLLTVGGKTFADIRRLLTHGDFRQQMVSQLDDPALIEFWTREFPGLPKAACDPILNKLSPFTLNKTVRNILGQPHSKIRFFDLMQGSKIFLANLSQGEIQEENSSLLGSILVSQFQLAAMRRATINREARTPFYLYIDEFQNFAAGEGSAFEKILSEARKYNLGLTLVHQYTSQVDPKVLNAIIGNVYTKIALRVGVDDARYLQRAFAGYTPDDLQNLNTLEAIASVGTAADSFNLKTYPYPQRPERSWAQEIIEHSRKHYATPRQNLENALRQQVGSLPPPPPPPSEARPPVAEEPKPKPKTDGDDDPFKELI